MEEFEQKKNPITLTRMILRDSKEAGASGDFAILLQSIQLAIKVIASATSKAGISNLYGVHGATVTNTSGDVQKKLDVLADEVFVNALSFSDQVSIMGSEENEDPYIIEGVKSGKYSVLFDPLDGSSNIDANVSIGSIFGIFKHDSEEMTPEIMGDKEKIKQLLLKPGRELIASGFSVYGPATMIVLATDKGVNEFTLDPTIGEFILTHENIRIPENGNIYSINEGNSKLFDPPTKKYIDLCKDRSYRARYVGSMISDVFRSLKYGGIFAYPLDIKGNSKLRLLYEVNPISFIIEKAGGLASTGLMSPLDIQPTHLHQRCAIWLGSKNMVDEVIQLYAEDTPNPKQ